MRWIFPPPAKPNTCRLCALSRRACYQPCGEEPVLYNMALLYWNHSFGSSDRGTKEISGKLSCPAYIIRHLERDPASRRFYCTCNSTSGAEELTTNSGPTLVGLLTGQFGRPKNHSSVHTLDSTSFGWISDVKAEPDLSATYFHGLKAVSQHHQSRRRTVPVRKLLTRGSSRTNPLDANPLSFLPSRQIVFMEVLVFV
jgi:hypothetical protein